jgi:glycosyltransferase involved in cell wall biosynthesis
MIVAGDFTPLGGMDAANHALARSLASTGDVHLVTHRAWDDLQQLGSVAVHRVPRPLNRHALGSALLSRAGRRLWQTLEPLGARAVVNGGNCRLAATNWVHYVHAAYTPCIAGSMARRSKTALVHRRDVAAEAAALKTAQVVVCNSQRTRADVVERIGVDASRTHVVYYGIDSARFSCATDAERRAARSAIGAAVDRPLLGFVGALGDRRKGFDTLFEAWTRLCADSAWDGELVVVGAGAELEAWRQRAVDGRTSSRIRFLGFRSDVPTILAALDGLVHPARYEAYGLSVHEAMCRGVPAIVTKSAGVAERYPAGLSDLLLDDPNDAGELAERLALWRCDLDRLRAGVAPFADTLRARSWDDMAQEMSAVAA